MTDSVAVNPFQREHRPRGLRRWIPGLQMLHTYQRRWLITDLSAGLVLTAILVPVGMGYAEAAGLPPIYGLYATIVPLIAYAIFGPRRILVLGPDSSLAANLAAGLFQGFSISSSSSRTPVAESAGAKTQITGLVGALCIALLLVFAPNLLQNLPSAALGAVVISAALSLIDLQSVRRFYRLRRSEAASPSPAFWVSP